MGLSELALSARAIATGPFRRTRLKKRCASDAAPMFVPFYHRVADTHPNSWTISRKEFHRHVMYCRETLQPVGLDEVQKRVAANKNSQPTITFTFDDGYAENCEFAIPLLIEQQIPTTYFVTTEFVNKQRSFPHDIEAGVGLPSNTPREIRQMSEQGIEIGLHTKTHVDFSKVYSPKKIRSEIMDGKDELEQMIGDTVRYFAFPYGLPEQLTQAAIEAVHEAGMIGFCSAFGAYNLPGRDSFHIRRFHGDPEFSRFMNWLSFDISKVDREPCVRYFLPPTDCVSTTNVSERLRLSILRPPLRRLLLRSLGSL